MIQLLGIRDYTASDGKVRRTDAFFEKGWTAPDIFELFKTPEKYLEQIPEEHRWNIYYTTASCTANKREFASQSIIPLDIDGIDIGTEAQVVDCVLEELGLKRSEVAVVHSGNGVHILIGLKTPYATVKDFEEQKIYYRALAGRINQALFMAQIAGKADTTVFSRGRILRLPFTENRKPDKPTKNCVLVERSLVPLDVDLISLSGLPQVGETDQIAPKAMIHFPLPDRNAIESKCAFIAHCKDTEDPITEPMWYAALSVVARFPDGRRVAHEYSRPMGRKHLGYTPDGTDYKVDHALSSAGPRTCSNIATMFEGCRMCPHRDKITSPIQLVDENTIRTQQNGFYEVVRGKDGNAQLGKPCYDDLEKWFRRQHEYMTLEQTQQVYIWTSTQWTEIPRSLIHAFAEKNFAPTPSNSMCLEFEAKLRRSNVRDESFIHVDGFLNFKNGVLELTTGKLLPHSQEYGFTYTIPYDYAPNDQGTPIFDRFLDDVTEGDEELKTLILEYVGYCISGVDPSLVQKCAILYGDGSNGKSVLLSLMRELVGRENSSAVSVPSLSKENYRYAIMHKMFNASDEAPSNTFMDSALFKAMVAGDIVEVRKLYMEPMMWKCSTKLIFNCNDLPHMGDFSYGMIRRLVIIPFRATFSRAKGNLDPNILPKILTEKSNIFKLCLDKFMEVTKRDYQFSQSTASNDELEEYMEVSDHISRFISDMCVADPASLNPVTIDVIYNAFCTWCDDNRIKPLVYSTFTQRFGKKVASRLPKIEKLRTNGNGGKKVTSWRYLRVNAVTPMMVGENF